MQTTTYTPTSIEEIVFGNSKSKFIIDSLCNGTYPFPTDRSLGIILYGTYGTGKSTLASMLPNAIENGYFGDNLGMQADTFFCEYGAHGQVILNSISETLEKTAYMNASTRWHFILDEVDNLTASTQKTLKSILNSKYGVFVLTTNYIANLDRGLIDRCILIEMNAPSVDQIMPLAKRMADDAGLVVDDALMSNAIHRLNGSFRNLQSTVPFVAHETKCTTESSVTA